MKKSLDILLEGLCGPNLSLAREHFNKNQPESIRVRSVCESLDGLLQLTELVPHEKILQLYSAVGECVYVLATSQPTNTVVAIEPRKVRANNAQKIFEHLKNASLIVGDAKHPATKHLSEFDKAFYIDHFDGPDILTTFRYLDGQKRIMKPIAQWLRKGGEFLTNIAMPTQETRACVDYAFDFFQGKMRKPKEINWKKRLEEPLTPVSIEEITSIAKKYGLNVAKKEEGKVITYSPEMMTDFLLCFYSTDDIHQGMPPKQIEQRKKTVSEELLPYVKAREWPLGREVFFKFEKA